MSSVENLTVGQRKRAAALSGHRGDTETVAVFLTDPDPQVRAVALNAAKRSGMLKAAHLQAASTDSDPAVRRRNIEVIASLGSEINENGQDGLPSELLATASEVVMALLNDPDETVVETAAWACGEIQPPPEGAVKELSVLATEASDALVRESATASLGAIGDPTGLGAILAACNDKATVRRRAVLALAPFEGEAVEAALTKALSDRDWQVRQAAEDLTEIPTQT